MQKAVYNDILKDMKTQVEEDLTESESENETESLHEMEDDGSNSGVVDYDTYSKVCEDYRKACIALQEREAEVADLLKQNEAKALTVKLLQDRLQLYGVAMNDTSSSTPCINTNDQVTQLQGIINDQKQVIQTLLSENGEKGGLEKVFFYSDCDFQFVALYEQRGEELKESKRQITELQKQIESAKEGVTKSREYLDLLSEVDILRHKSSLLDVGMNVFFKVQKVLLENDNLRARLRMEVNFSSYPVSKIVPSNHQITPAYAIPQQYPLFPPGFGYSQNTSVTDGTSIGHLADEELEPSVTPSIDTKSTRSKSKRGRLGNREYFQVVQAVNVLQKSICDREATASPVKVNSANVLRMTKSVMEMKGETLRRELEQCVPLVALANEREMQEFESALKAVVRGLTEGNGLCVCLY